MVNSAAISVRIPSSLSDKIDNAISNSKSFNYRADLVFYATTRMMEMISTRLNINIHYEKEKSDSEITDERKLEIIQEAINEFLEYGKKEYDKYKGDFVQILIRAPIGWIAYLGQFSSKVDGVQDFIRYSIVDFIENGGFLVIKNPFLYTLERGFFDYDLAQMPTEGMGYVVRKVNK